MGRGPANENRYTPLYKALRELIRLENHSRSFSDSGTHARKAAQARDEQLSKVLDIAGEVLGSSTISRPANKERTIRKLVTDADRYSLALRIAARFTKAGGTEDEWMKLSKQLSDLPQPIMNEIHNKIRDIERGMYVLSDIPDLV